jgi:hypothetical protein
MSAWLSAGSPHVHMLAVLADRCTMLPTFFTCCCYALARWQGQAGHLSMNQALHAISGLAGSWAQLPPPHPTPCFPAGGHCSLSLAFDDPPPTTTSSRSNTSSPVPGTAPPTWHYTCPGTAQSGAPVSSSCGSSARPPYAVPPGGYTNIYLTWDAEPRNKPRPPPYTPGPVPAGVEQLLGRHSPEPPPYSSPPYTSASGPGPYSSTGHLGGGPYSSSGCGPTPGRYSPPPATCYSPPPPSITGGPGGSSSRGPSPTPTTHQQLDCFEGQQPGGHHHNSGSGSQDMWARSGGMTSSSGHVAPPTWAPAAGHQGSGGGSSSWAGHVPSNPGGGYAGGYAPPGTSPQAAAAAAGGGGGGRSTSGYGPQGEPLPARYSPELQHMVEERLQQQQHQQQQYQQERDLAYATQVWSNTHQQGPGQQQQQYSQQGEAWSVPPPGSARLTTAAPSQQQVPATGIPARPRYMDAVHSSAAAAAAAAAQRRFAASKTMPLTGRALVTRSGTGDRLSTAYSSIAGRTVPGTAASAVAAAGYRAPWGSLAQLAGAGKGPRPPPTASSCVGVAIKPGRPAPVPVSSSAYGGFHSYSSGGAKAAAVDQAAYASPAAAEAPAPLRKGQFCGKVVMQPPGGRSTLNIFG